MMKHGSGRLLGITKVTNTADKNTKKVWFVFQHEKNGESYRANVWHFVPHACLDRLRFWLLERDGIPDD